MPRNTDELGEKVDDLVKQVATLEADLRNVRDKDLGEKVGELVKQVTTHEEGLGNVREVVKKLEQKLEESLKDASRKRWILLGAVFAAMLTMLVALLVKK